MAENRESWHELWATFSVRGHCRRGAFIAEVLLYDKLVIPVVPTDRDVAAEDAQAQWARWIENEWAPRRQTDIVEVLKDRAELIPWTPQREAEWAALRQRFADARHDGYFLTGSVLERFAPQMARTVVAVSPTYSLKELEAASGIRRQAPHDKLPAGALLAVLGHELLLPSLDGGYLAALARAVEVASTDEYRRARRALFEWQQRFVSAEAATDARSVRAAVEAMRNLVENVKTATAEQKRWRRLKRCFSFFDTTWKLAAPVAPIAAAIGGASAALGTFALEHGAPRPYAADDAVPAAMMIADARQRLGI